MVIRTISVFAVLGAAVILGPSASGAATVTTCPDAAGAPFAFSVGPSHYSGTEYRVTATSVSCGFATGWVTKLTHMAPEKGFAIRKLLAGPAGWTCKGNGYASALRAAPMISGSCYAGSASSPRKLFQWSADTRAARTPPIVLDPTATTGSSAQTQSSSTQQPSPSTQPSSSQTQPPIVVDPTVTTGSTPQTRPPIVLDPTVTNGSASQTQEPALKQMTGGVTSSS